MRVISNFQIFFRASSSESENALLLQFCFFLFADFVTSLNFYNSISYISITTADTNMVFPQKVWQDSRLHFGRKNFRKIFRLSGFLGQKYKKFTCNNLVQWYSTRLTCKRLKVRTRMPPIFLIKGSAVRTPVTPFFCSKSCLSNGLL